MHLLWNSRSWGRLGSEDLSKSRESRKIEKAQRTLRTFSNPTSFLRAQQPEALGNGPAEQRPLCPGTNCNPRWPDLPLSEEWVMDSNWSTGAHELFSQPFKLRGIIPKINTRNGTLIIALLFFIWLHNSSWARLWDFRLSNLQSSVCHRQVFSSSIAMRSIKEEGLNVN